MTPGDLVLALIGLRRWIVYSRSPATEINCAQFGVKSQFTDLPAVYTSSLPYLTHICEDFLLLEKESKFIFMLFIRNYTWGYQVISGGVGWKREILWDDVIARGRWRHRTWYLPFFLCFTHVFLCWSTSLRRSEHACSADEFSSHRCRSCCTGEGWCKLYRRELWLYFTWIQFQYVTYQLKNHRYVRKYIYYKQDDVRLAIAHEIKSRRAI